MIVRDKIEPLKSGEPASENLSDADQKIYEELGELAKYVEMTTRTIRDMEAPVTTSTDQIPQAMDHLSELAKMTEEGAHRVMAIADELQDNNSKIKALLSQVQTELNNEASLKAQGEKISKILELLEADEPHYMNIAVALSFQDLVAQRVKKLSTVFEEVQHKLLKLVVIFGVQKEQAKPATEGRGYEMLKQLEESRATALKQDLVDDILGEFGFN